jgi:hypothetical protein
MPRSLGRTGYRWRMARKQVLDVSRVCWLCGHDGAGDVDHEPPLPVLEAMGLDPCDVQYLRPAHGSLSRCSDCGRCCNQSKGNGAGHSAPIASEVW